MQIPFLLFTTITATISEKVSYVTYETSGGD